MKILTTTLLFILISSFAFATQEKKQARICVTAPGGYLDETMIYFDLGVSPIYTASEDGPKAYNTVATSPSIYSLSSDNVACSTNGYSRLTSSEIVPLGIKTDTAGLYTFTASQLNHFDSSTIIRLEDRLTNTFTNLRSSFYQVVLDDDQTIAGRFFLHISSAIQYSSVSAGCANNDGVLNFAQDNTIQWTNALLYNSEGVLMDSFANVSGGFSFTALPEGDYNLVMTLNDFMTTRSLHVEGTYVVAHFQPSTITASVNQEIIFNTTVHNGTIYQWELGDSTMIGGIANPSYSYPQAGVYEVILKCTNAAGCEYRDSVMVTVSAATGITNVENKQRNIWSSSNMVTVVLNEEIKQGAELKIYNVLGQPVYNNPVTAQTSMIALTEQPTGYYIVSLQNDKVLTTKRVFIAK